MTATETAGRRRRPAKKAAGPSEDLVQLAAALADASAAEGRAKARRRELAGRVLELMQSEGFDSADRSSFRAELAADSFVTATYVAPTVDVVDGERLREQLSPQLWTRISTRVLDPEALDAAVAAGRVDAAAVAAATEAVAGRPYVKAARK